VRGGSPGVSAARRTRYQDFAAASANSAWAHARMETAQVLSPPPPPPPWVI
jgi:hypothetical protein